MNVESTELWYPGFSEDWQLKKPKCNDPLKPKYKIFILRFHYSNNLLRANKILPFVPPDFMKIGVSISSFLQEVPIVYYTDKHFDKLSPN